MKYKNYFYSIVLPLIAGVFVYTIFRKPVTFFHSFFGIRQTPIPLTENLFTQFLLYYFPDMCWAFALTSAIVLFNKYNNYVCAAISILFLSLVEASQADWTITRYDFTDLALMSVSAVLSIKIVKK